MKSASAKGNYYKLRTKKWLEAKGYGVAFLERVMWLPPKTPGERPIPVKRDQFGADLLAVSATEIVFVQVKLNRSHVGLGRREFGKCVVPAFAEQWIVVWELRAREPEIHVMNRREFDGETHEESERI